MISAAERQERLEAVEDVIGTHRAEGIAFDEPTLKLMQQYADGDVSLEQLLTSMRTSANALGAGQRSLTNAA